jgi:hypothetical protein
VEVAAILTVRRRPELVSGRRSGRRPCMFVAAPLRHLLVSGLHRVGGT